MKERDEYINDVHLSRNVRGLTPSATVAINDRSNELIRQGRSIVKLGLGQSPFPVPPSVVEALRQNAPQKAYLPVRGLFELRKAIADHHCRTFDIECTADDVLVGPGSKELMFLLQLCFDGEVVIPAPAWVSYAPQARIIGRRIHMLPTSIENDYQPTAEELDAFCVRDGGRPRILVLNYPSNPTGRTLSRERLEQLAEVAKAHDALILSDEIYGKLNHEGRHQSIVPLYPEGSIFSGGLSKWCGAGGWRLGLFVFPERLRWLQNTMAAAGSETFTATSAPIQYAAVRAFREGPEIQRYVHHTRRILKTLGTLLARRLAETGARVLPPEGAFYLFPDFSPLGDKLRARGILTSTQMCERLLEETGVAILPGADFGRTPEEFTARLAYVDFDGSTALQASEEVPLDRSLDDGFVRSYCERVVGGVEKICEWVCA